MNFKDMIDKSSSYSIYSDLKHKVYALDDKINSLKRKEINSNNILERNDELKNLYQELKEKQIKILDIEREHSTTLNRPGLISQVYYKYDLLWTIPFEWLDNTNDLLVQCKICFDNLHIKPKFELYIDEFYKLIKSIKEIGYDPHEYRHYCKALYDNNHMIDIELVSKNSQYNSHIFNNIPAKIDNSITRILAKNIALNTEESHQIIKDYILEGYDFNVPIYYNFSFQYPILLINCYSVELILWILNQNIIDFDLIGNDFLSEACTSNHNIKVVEWLVDHKLFITAIESTKIYIKDHYPNKYKLIEKLLVIIK